MYDFVVCDSIQNVPKCQGKDFLVLEDIVPTIDVSHRFSGGLVRKEENVDRTMLKFQGTEPKIFPM
jgi:hypothetical protein